MRKKQPPTKGATHSRRWMDTPSAGGCDTCCERRPTPHLRWVSLAEGLAQIKPQHRVASGLNTRLFFDLIDRRYNKEGNFNMIFTSNKNSALWREDSTLLCALDRIFDEATVFKLRGESFRGKKLDTVSVQTGKVKAVELLADQQEE